MNISMNWLKDFVDIDCDTKTFCDAMTLSGSKVEVYKNLGEEISNVVVGKIVKIEKHPDADKLQICKIDVGTGTLLQIVTGANNIGEGDFVPVALHKSTLAGGLKITKGKLRGVESEGMLCSVEELGFDKTDFPDAPEYGIYILDDSYELGTDIKEVFGLNDSMVEFEITSNRKDCFSIIGIAREAAATFDKSFNYNPLVIARNEAISSLNSEDVADYIKVEVQNSDLCRRYTAAVVKNIKIQPSPKWMQERLRTVGIRPINNIVDITNYVMVEIGQPMHAFDLDLVADRKIIVKNAQKGEKFTTLDGIERNLDNNMLMICDGEKPVAIAGIMGGENSKINEDTKIIMFEAANFNGTNIRVNSKKLGLRTDSSGKFEKDLDPNLTLEGINRALALIEELDVGEIVNGIVDVYPYKIEEMTISYSQEKINALLGTKLSEDEMIKIFEKLEFKVSKQNKFLTIPTFRQDIEHNADLAEEVARIYGYDNIEPTVITSKTTIGKLDKNQTVTQMIKKVMEAEGLSEIITYSFESPKVLEKLALNINSDSRKIIKVMNPLGEDFSIMRTQTINGMLNSLSTNYNRRNEYAYLYEISKTYIPKDLPITELPNEVTNLTIGMYGDVDFYKIKGIIEVLIKKLGTTDDYEANASIDYMHPGKTADILIDGNVVGYIGEVHPQITKNYEIEEKVYIACINVDELITYVNLTAKYKQLPKYPAVNRDIALVLKDEIEVKQIEMIIKQNAGKILENIELFDIYKGNQIEADYKSVAYRVTLRANDRTLTDEEINLVMGKILGDMKTKFGAKLR
ncbi:MAG: phenylalanine--tRNA ligase subunit beta [Clostridiales bacterium GWE2_32_10]|nr:MAG: phenylalanine--tRNA ligase subunit beta [Clostridiales bacterium GWE2_32_10]HBY21207.1 phenylalanine--tRNA ligase subunit beta [Clostridiales bacterium]